MPPWNLDPRLDRWLDHHRPGGFRVVPGAVLVGWMLESAGDGEWLALREVRFLRPVHVSDVGTRVLLEAGVETGSGRPLRLVEGRSIGEPASTATIGSSLDPGVAPEPLQHAESRAEAIPETFHGPLFLGFSPPLLLHPAGLDGVLAFAADRPERMPRLGPACGPDARHLDAVFQAANHLRQLTGLPRGVPVEAEEVQVHRTREAAGPLQVRVRWTDPGAEERADVWCMDGSGRPLIVVRGYLGAPASFAPGSR